MGTRSADAATRKELNVRRATESGFNLKKIN